MSSRAAAPPTFDGSLVGFPAGLDLIGWESTSGHHDRAGLFIDRATADGDVRGEALGWNDLSVGGVKLNGTSVGAYWTHIGPQDWYLDGVLMGPGSTATPRRTAASASTSTARG